MVPVSQIMCPCCKDQMVQFTQSKNWVYFKCPVCHFWTTRTHKGEIPTYLYLDDGTFDRNYKTDWEQMVQEATQAMQYKFSLLGLKPGKMLDIGCSEGPYVAASQMLGWEAHGFEIDEAKVARARERGLDVTVPDYHQTAVKFDFIMMRHTIEHIPDFMDIISSAKDLLEPHGILCIETPNQAGLSALLKRNKVRNDRFLGHLYPPTHIHAFTPKTYTWIASKISLKLLKIYTYSPADKNWVYRSLYTKRGLIPLIHAISAKIGLGENLAVFLQLDNP